MSYKTITFQKSECGGRPAGFLTRWYRDKVYIPTHYCIAVPYELYDSMKYTYEDGPVDPETGEPTKVRKMKGVTYIINIDRLKEEHPKCESEIVVTEDITLLSEVPLG